PTPESCSLSYTSLCRSGDLLGVEPGERRPEVLPLAQDHQPGQTGLERLQAHPLEQGLLTAQRHAPLVVVIVHVVRRGRPRTPHQLSHFHPAAIAVRRSAPVWPATGGNQPAPAGTPRASRTCRPRRTVARGLPTSAAPTRC